jgi:plastocyanin
MKVFSQHKTRGAVAGSAAVLTLLLVATGCGSSSAKASGGGGSSVAPAGPSASMSMSMGGSAPVTASGAVTIDVKNFSFNPMKLTVTPGTKVTWKFEDAVAHTVKANDGSFSSPPLKSGQTYEHTFTKAGTFAYICSIHQYMTATITVK